MEKAKTSKLTVKEKAVTPAKGKPLGKAAAPKAELATSGSAPKVKTTPALVAKAPPASTVHCVKVGTGRMTVTVGNVTLQVSKPGKAEVEKNVKSGHDALNRAIKTIATPGVKLAPRATPIYYADPNHPGRIVREHLGKKESGTFTLNGRFTPKR